ncbi:hypothetical protein D3C86_1758720 [compost metagenome]
MQAQAGQQGGLPLDGQHARLAVAEDDQPGLAQLARQVVQLRGGGIQQQAVAAQQPLGIGGAVAGGRLLVPATEAMAQAAPPGGVDLRTQGSLRQAFPGPQGLANPARSPDEVFCCSC